MNRPQDHPRKNRLEYRPLLSLSSVLILSGFLVGMVASRLISPDLQNFVLATGVVGIISFVALDHVKVRRRHEAEHDEQVYVEGRLLKHISRCLETADEAQRG